jgi:uncharacterized protein (TIGR02118 family)
MVRLTVLYGHPAHAGAFERHYAETHMPLVARIRGAQRAEAARIVGTPDGSPPAYHRIFEFWFDSLQQLQASMGSPEGQAAVAVADVPNYATGGVTIVISEVG